MPATGKITQVIGSTFDAEFPEDQLPRIYNAIKIETNENGQTMKLTGEVASHLGGGRIRAVALGSTDGLRRGVEVVDTGGALSVPGGTETLGRGFHLLGETPSKLHSAEASADEVRAKIKSAEAALSEAQAELDKARSDVVAAAASIDV